MIKIKEIFNNPRGTIRTKVTALIDCPICHSKMKLIEQIEDDGTVTGELLVLDKGKSQNAN